MGAFKTTLYDPTSRAPANKKSEHAVEVTIKEPTDVGAPDILSVDHSDLEDRTRRNVSSGSRMKC